MLQWFLPLAMRLGAKFDCLKTPTILDLESFEVSPFHWITLIIFLFAIIHTLSVNQIHKYARLLETREGPKRERQIQERSLKIQALYFLSEVELVFALWAIPLAIVIAIGYGWHEALSYINTRDYTEPLFVVVIMSLASTRPIVQAAESVLKRIAKFLGGSLAAWWHTLLILGPLLGSFITEVGAMALCALLLARHFFEYHPSPKLAYATLGLLFVNISVGGVLTDFASPAVLVLAHCWHWNALYILTTFGFKAIVGVSLSSGLYWLYFRREFIEMDRRKQMLAKIHTPHPEELQKPVPAWLTCAHIAVITWIVMVSHYPAIFIGSFVLFLGLHQATRGYQYPIRLSRPLLIGLFLGGLVIHGGLQGWWVINVLEGLSPVGVLGSSLMLAAFSDNTAIAYLATLMPSWGTAFQYALFSGIVSGGGLTVIANAPNPAGFAILGHYFEGGVSPIKLFLAALFPTCLLYFLYFITGPF